MLRQPLAPAATAMQRSAVKAVSRWTCPGAATIPATATKPAGIIVTIADYNVLEKPIKAAIAKGIPVITVNSGTAEESKKLGALMHIGQPEYDAGKGAGERAKAAGVTKFLCVNHYITNNASVERCQGYADGLGVKLGDQMIDSGMDPTDVYNRVKAYLTAHLQSLQEVLGP